MKTLSIEIEWKLYSNIKAKMIRTKRLIRFYVWILHGSDTVLEMSMMQVYCICHERLG